MPASHLNIAPAMIQNNTSFSSIVAAGYGNNDQNISFPLIALSEDNGNHWSYVLDDKTLPLPNDFRSLDGTDGKLSCDHQDCVLAMNYRTKKSYRSAILLATTHDGGHHWAYTLDGQSSIIPKDQQTSSFINDINCADGTCVVASGHFLLVSQNAGTDWQLVPMKNKDYASDVTCNNSQCLIAGITTKADKHYIFIARSTDKGMHWNDQVTHQDLEGQLNSISCHDKTCVAAGYSDSDSPQPLLLTSQNSGENWKSVNIPRSPKVPENLNGGLNSAVCDTSHCFMDGVYSDFSDLSDESPYVIVTGMSDSAGLNWKFSYLESIRDNENLNYLVSSFPNKSDSCFVYEYSLHCSGDTCVAAGTCDTPNDENDKGYTPTPLVAMTWDRGLHWEFPIDSNIPHLPSNFKSGEFATSALIN